jgi:hypothetical protein
MRKTQQRMAKLHAQIANIRANVVRQLTPICGAINVIIIEDLNGAGMPKKSQAGPGDGGYGLWRISEATRIEGHAMRQKGGGREPFVSQQQNLFHSASGTHHDRDINATMNLQKVTESSVGSSSPFGVSWTARVTGLWSPHSWMTGLEGPKKR